MCIVYKCKAYPSLSYYRTNLTASILYSFSYWSQQPIHTSDPIHRCITINYDSIVAKQEVNLVLGSNQSTDLFIAIPDSENLYHASGSSKYTPLPA